ncbi:hypothetical protein AX17_001701 [Amanita inopinata Kibby_2008]|nr:hypothetical protein AX17_001701 [Amanita inopinata Kibby_2008]
MRCPELSKLGKPLCWTSIKFIRRAPGSVDLLLSPFPSKRVVYPTHPAVATNLSRREFPHFYNEAFRIKAYPLALLERTDWEAANTGENEQAFAARTGRAEDTQCLCLPSALDPVPDKRQVEMHLSIATSIKNTSKLAVVRTAINRRVKHSIELIITRGAHVNTTKVKQRSKDGWKEVEKKVIAFDDREAREMGPKWVLNGWMYIFHPTLLLYRMPYHDLVPLLREAFRRIYGRGIYLEQQWVAVRQNKSEQKSGNRNPKTGASPKTSSSTNAVRQARSMFSSFAS